LEQSFAAAMYRHIDEHTMQIELKIAQHLVDESDFNFLKLHLLSHFSDNVHRLGNLLNASSKLSKQILMELK
jgi:hypothetical protein